jgi:hypothetical protein
MAGFVVGTLIVLGTLSGLHYIGRALNARDDRVRRELIAARLSSRSDPTPAPAAGPLVPEDEAPCE